MENWERIHAHHERIREDLERIDREDHAIKQMLTMCHFVGGKHNGVRMTEAQVEKDLCNGKHSEDLSEARNAGGCVHHAVLDNCPMVDGYLSPMWDGGELRYETQEVYDALSM